MSVQATTWVWNQSKAGGTARLVLLALADHAHPDGTHAFPAVAELARMCGVSDRTVQRTLRDLEASGEIRTVREATRYLPTEYAIPGVGRGDIRGDRLTPLDPAGVSSEAPGVTKEPFRGDTAMSPEPKEPTPTEEPKGRSARPRARATRIPDDFTLTAEMRAWAHAKGVLGNLPRETDRFRDYWLGAGRPKADWVATWRNWISREADDPRNQTVRRSISSVHAEPDRLPTEDERVAAWGTEKRRAAVDASRASPDFAGLLRPVGPAYGGAS
jgi:hypothetical protein